MKNGGSNRISEVWECHVACPVAGLLDPLRKALPIDCSAESGDGGLGAGGLDAVGLSWMSWDMIERCAALSRDSVELWTRGGQNAVFTP